MSGTFLLGSSVVERWVVSAPNITRISPIAMESIVGFGFPIPSSGGWPLWL